MNKIKISFFKYFTSRGVFAEKLASIDSFDWGSPRQVRIFSLADMDDEAAGRLFILDFLRTARYKHRFPVRFRRRLGIYN